MVKEEQSDEVFFVIDGWYGHGTIEFYERLRALREKTRIPLQLSRAKLAKDPDKR